MIDENVDAIKTLAAEIDQLIATHEDTEKQLKREVREGEVAIESLRDARTEKSQIQGRLETEIEVVMMIITKRLKLGSSAQGFCDKELTAKSDRVVFPFFVSIFHHACFLLLLLLLLLPATERGYSGSERSSSKAQFRAPSWQIPPPRSLVSGRC